MLLIVNCVCVVGRGPEVVSGHDELCTLSFFAIFFLRKELCTLSGWCALELKKKQYAVKSDRVQSSSGIACTYSAIENARQS
jgi:hypothetical protein